jgi:hypothetical protein
MPESAIPRVEISQERRDLLRVAATLGAAGTLSGVSGIPAASASSGAADQKETGSMALSTKEISDRIEIEDLMVRYCYAIDDRDWDTYRKLFTPDAILDDTVTGGIRSGVEEHVAYLTRALSKIKISQHAISTILFEIDGDNAKARSHCSCPMVVDIGDGKTHVFFQGLWYRDKLVRTNGGWRFSERIEEGYWTHNLPAGFKF